jgi:Uma2 family endonuclease
MVAVRERKERTRVWTAADLLAMPHDLDHRYELVDGRLVTMAPTGGTHGRRTFDLTAALGAYAMQHGLGVVLAAETGFNLTRPGGGAARPSSHLTWPLCVPKTRL